MKRFYKKYGWKPKNLDIKKKICKTFITLATKISTYPNSKLNVFLTLNWAAAKFSSTFLLLLTYRTHKMPKNKNTSSPFLQVGDAIVQRLLPAVHPPAHDLAQQVDLTHCQAPRTHMPPEPATRVYTTTMKWMLFYNDHTLPDMTMSLQ